MPTRFASFALALVLVAGCGGRVDTSTDAGHDAGPPGIDAAPGDDAGSDGGPVSIDGGPVSTDGGPLDAGATEDAGTDAGTTDAGVRGEDACVPPPCAAPPDGCHYEGATFCTCGTLVCAPVATCEPACGAGEYCDLCASAPQCEPRPTPEGRICTTIYMPVCGCDGMTYSNACALSDAGIGLLHDGACGSTI